MLQRYFVASTDDDDDGDNDVVSVAQNQRQDTSEVGLAWHGIKSVSVSCILCALCVVSYCAKRVLPMQKSAPIDDIDLDSFFGENNRRRTVQVMYGMGCIAIN